jgi:hypothetical protein
VTQPPVDPSQQPDQPAGEPIPSEPAAVTPPPPPVPPAAPYGTPPPPPPPPPPAGYATPAGVAAVPATNQKAIWALVLGISGFFCCGLLGIGGLVLGSQARGEIKASGGTQGGDGLALAGMITGGVALAVMLIQIPIALSLFAINGGN